MLKNKNATILAVDDNDALRYSLSRTLQGGGYQVIEARNGAEALRLAESCPDLITLDVHLPDKDGFEISRLLKANPRTKHIPILHISATFVEAEYRVRGLETADGYLAEPISREELLATVGALLRLKQAEREAQMHAARNKHGATSRRPTTIWNSKLRNGPGNLTNAIGRFGSSPPACLSCRTRNAGALLANYMTALGKCLPQ